MTKKVAIIGGGIAGLYTALAFDESLNKEKYQFIVYERMANIGGLWNFTEDVGIDSSDGLPVHGPMYKNLTTNAPNNLIELEFTDLFSEDEQRFVSRERYLKALFRLADTYNLYKYIKCSHYVQNVKKIENGFVLEIINTTNNDTFYEDFDFVVVAAGRYNFPKWPKLESNLLKKFGGTVFHSKDVKDTTKYNDKRVLCIGSGFSALDIGLLLHKASAPLVTINARPGLVMNNCTYAWKENFKLVLSPIKDVNDKRIIFEDGTSDEFDVVIFCTGYLCEFPFLEKKLQPENKNPIFPHLYEAIVDVKHPQLMFVNAFYAFLTKLCPYFQAHFICDHLNNDLKNLPNEDHMEEAIQQWYGEIPTTTVMDDFAQFHFDYYYRLQKYSPRKLFDRRHEKYILYNILLLLAGTHIEKSNKTLNDFI